MSKDGSIAVWEEVQPLTLCFRSILSFFVQPVKIKAERSATPRIIEAGLGEVICVFYNSASKQFWTSHKASNTIVMWSSTGNKDREMRCACAPLRNFLIGTLSTATHCPSITSYFIHDVLLECDVCDRVTRLESAHPVNCFCKVGEEEVWAGTFDSIIMLSNKGDRLHSTSTGAGRMIFIKQQGSASSCFIFAFQPHSTSHLLPPLPVMCGLAAGFRPATSSHHHLFFSGLLYIRTTLVKMSN